MRKRRLQLLPIRPRQRHPRPTADDRHGTGGRDGRGVAPAVPAMTPPRRQPGSWLRQSYLYGTMPRTYSASRQSYPAHADDLRNPAVLLDEASVVPVISMRFPTSDSTPPP